MADTPQNAYPTTLLGFELPAQQDVNQQPSSGLSFAISGRMPGGLTRKDAVALLQKLGHTHAASVTKNTHYLIWDGATAGKKLAQALRYRTTLLDAAQLPALLERTELPGRTHSALPAKALRLMNTDDAGQRQLRIDDVSPPAAEKLRRGAKH